MKHPASPAGMLSDGQPPSAAGGTGPPTIHASAARFPSHGYVAHGLPAGAGMTLPASSYAAGTSAIALTASTTWPLRPTAMNGGQSGQRGPPASALPVSGAAMTSGSTRSAYIRSTSNVEAASRSVVPPSPGTV